jgi:hypothetical protein
MPQEGEATTPQEGQEPKPAAEPKEDQEPKGKQPPPETFDREYVEKLRAEAAKHRTEAQEAKARAQEYEDRDKSELEKLDGKLKKAEEAKLAADTKLLRFEVAAEKKVPADAVALLSGTTREELEAQADKLLELTKEAGKSPDFDGGAREPAPEQRKPEEAHNRDLLKLLGLEEQKTT